MLDLSPKRGWCPIGVVSQERMVSHWSGLSREDGVPLEWSLKTSFTVLLEFVTKSVHICWLIYWLLFNIQQIHICYTNMTSFFRFSNKQAIYLDDKFSLAHVQYIHLSQVLKSQNRSLGIRFLNLPTHVKIHNTVCLPWIIS